MKLKDLKKSLTVPLEMQDALSNDWSSLLKKKDFKSSLYEHPEYMKTFYIGDFMQFSYKPSMSNLKPEDRSKELIIDPLIIFLGYYNDVIYGINLKRFMFDNQVTKGLKFVEDYVRRYFDFPVENIFQRKDAYNNPLALSRFWQSIIEKAKNQNELIELIRNYVRQYSIKDFKVKNIRKVINIEVLRMEMRKAKVYRSDGVTIEDVFYK